MENPYITEYPANPEFFAGRKEESKRFETALGQTIVSKPSSPKNIAIVGDWGVGKTSLLNKCLDSALKKDCFVCKITLTPEKCKDMNNFIYSSIDEIHKTVWNSKIISVKIKEEISKWKLESFQIAGLGLKRKRPEIPSISLFKNSLIDLWNRLKNSVPAVILMYDDFHYLVENYPNGLYDLRGIFQELRESNCRFMLMLTGSSNLFAKIRGLSEPVIRFFEHIELNNFSLEETKEAILLPLNKKNITFNFEEGVFKSMYSKTLGHPYFVMFFAHDLFEHKSGGKITLEGYNSTYDLIFDHLSAMRFIRDLAIASEKEKEVLYSLAMKKEDIILLKELSDINNIGTHLKRLENKKLITKLERGGYGLYHPLFKEYLVKLNRENYKNYGGM